MSCFLPGSKNFVAIDNMASFPVCSLALADGTFAAFIYNHPSHIRGPHSGIDMWVSADGALWERRSCTTDESEGLAHANHAVGINAQGELLVATSRFEMDPTAEPIVRNWKTTTVRLSKDDGHTWSTVGQIDTPLPGQNMMPFGRMLLLPDGQLVVSAYASLPYDPSNDNWTNTNFVLRSSDGGRTWSDMSIIEPDNHNETGLLRLPDGRWLAAARTLRCDHIDIHEGWGQYLGGRLELFASDDAGRTWQRKAGLSFPGQHPGNLLQLRDGRVLLTYGSRMPGMLGVQARLSADGGATWSSPIMLVNGLDTPDCGYPSTLETDDGKLVTIYYTGSAPWHKRYHMAALNYHVDLLPQG